MQNSKLRRRALGWIAGALLCGVAPALAAPPELELARGIQHYQKGELAQAAALLQRPATENPAAGHFLGLALIRQGKLAEGRRALARAVELDGDSPRLLHDLGLAYLEEGNVAWAARVLTHARELAPEDGPICFHLGLALLQLGSAEEAAQELARARGMPGVDPKQAALQLAMAHYLSQDWEASRSLAGLALDGPQQGAARQLLRSAYEAEGIEAALISAELITGAVVDTNPLYHHETQGTTAMGPTFAGRLILRPLVDPRNILSGELALARTSYFGLTDDAMADASPTDLRGAVRYTRRFLSDVTAYHLAASYSFGLSFLDGPAPLTDGNHIFLEEHGGYLALQRLTQAGRSSQLRYGLVRSLFADLPRNNWAHELSAEHAETLLAQRVRLIGWLSLRHEAAQVKDYNALIPGLGLGASLLAPLRLIVGLRADYAYKNFYDSEGERWPQQRLDHQLMVTAEIGRALPWNLRARITFQRLQNISTVTTFDYSRNLGTLSLSWSMP